MTKMFKTTIKSSEKSKNKCNSRCV